MSSDEEEIVLHLNITSGLLDQLNNEADDEENNHRSYPPTPEDEDIPPLVDVESDDEEENQGEQVLMERRDAMIHAMRHMMFSQFLDPEIFEYKQREMMRRYVEKCIECKEAYDPDKNHKYMLNCGHEYCTNCIREMFNTDKTCPCGETIAYLEGSTILKTHKEEEEDIEICNICCYGIGKTQQKGKVKLGCCEQEICIECAHKCLKTKEDLKISNVRIDDVGSIPLPHIYKIKGLCPYCKLDPPNREEINLMYSLLPPRYE